MDGKQLQSQYKDHLSDFQNWDQRAHAQEYILYPKNMGYHLCIDETALSKGDLYTILINRDKRGRKGSIIAVIQGTKTDDIIAVLTKMPQELRNQVKEITLDMAGSMQKIAKTCFPRAMQVIDRFHVQKLVYEAVQELRITYRWQVIKEENKAMKAAKEKGEVYKAEELENGDTLRQLLAEADIYYYLNHLINGPRVRKSGQNYFSSSLKILSTYITTHWSWERSFPQTMTRM
ncbi:ISAon1 family transposase [Bacteroides xylanisolvens]